MLFIFFAFTIALSQPPNQSIKSIQLHGNISLGYYYADIYLGTPPQIQSFIIDTGSTLFAIPCNMCTSCGLRHLNPKFDVTRSNTSKLLTCQSGKAFCTNGCKDKQSNNSCEFNLDYLQGSSINGIMVEDVVSLSIYQAINDTKSQNLKQLVSKQETSQEKIQNSVISSNKEVRAVFGCITKQTNHFLNQKADGIFGLASNQISNVLSQLSIIHSTQIPPQLSFSICIADNGGLFSIGGRDTKLKTQNPVLIKYRTDNRVYSLGIDDILIGNKSLNLSTLQIFTGEGITIDSGATYTYFPFDHYHKIIEQIQKVGKQLGFVQFSGQQSKCYHFPDKLNETQISLETQINKFPSIQIKLGSKRIPWIARNYFFVRNQNKRQICLGFMPLTRWILGNTWMIGRQIYFNLHKKQITISESFCSSSENYTPPKFHKMYLYEKSPLIQIFSQLPNNVFLAIAMIIGIILLITCIIVVLLLIIKKNDVNKVGLIERLVEGVEMIPQQQQHTENMQ